MTIDMKNYRDYLRTANKTLRDHYDNDPLIIACREAARIKIADALRPDGTLDWSKLPNLLTRNPKLVKSDKEDVLTAGIALAASWASGYNGCNNASIGCGMSCLTFSGHGQKHMVMDGRHNVHIARITRMLLWMEYRDQFKARLTHEIGLHKRKADRLGVTCSVRPNVVQDVMWEKLFPEMFSMFSDVVFYDYTKDINRNVDHIPNYSLTFSLNEANGLFFESAILKGWNVAVVLCTLDKKLPKKFKGYDVINGDLHDYRPSDPRNVVVGLLPKGKDAWNDTSGFVNRVL
tara:strand:- start:169 stop:1038 length:870 start_codon:yes stop_codon:yes gene_type:complete